MSPEWKGAVDLMSCHRNRVTVTEYGIAGLAAAASATAQVAGKIRRGYIPAMAALEINAELDALLTQFAKAQGRPKAALAHEAVAQYLEDLEDYALAEEALRDYDPSKNVSLEVVARELGLDH